MHSQLQLQGCHSIRHYMGCVIDFEIEWNEKRAFIRSAWIIRADEDFPRLTTCYVL
jgi:hypothetical protein